MRFRRLEDLVRWSYALLVLSAVVPKLAASEAEARPTPVFPLQAELVGVLDSSRVKQGAPVLARVLQDWKEEGCHLRAGAMVQGRVVQVTPRTRQDKNASLQLAFDKADCNNRPSAEYRMTLIALIGPWGDESPYAGMMEAPPLADVPALSMGVNTASAKELPVGTRSVTNASGINEYAQITRKTRKLPEQILAGQTIDMPRTDLKVAAGIDGATVVIASNRDARLERRTTMIFLPEASYLPHKPAAVEAARKPLPEGIKPLVATDSGVKEPAPVSEDEAADVTEVCSTGCNLAGPMISHRTSESASTATLPIDSLGYAPHDKQRATTFDHETTLTYLSPESLLCTFDPHQLRARTGDDHEPIRTVRAVLIDARTHGVKKVMNWRVKGDDAYLWRIGGGQILVHMGRELRRFDSELRPMQSITVDGRVAWVVSSPSNDHIAVGIVRERYSRTVFKELEALAGPLDDDLEVRLYDRDLHLLSASIRSLQSLQPVLSDKGELRVHRESRGRWKIVEYRWDRTEHELATVSSICRPLLSAPEHDLAFVTGCMATTGNVWYRMLRGDGHAVLKGESGSDEVAQSAEGALAGSFAVRILKAARSMSVDQPFNRSDLTREEIAIYRSADGARLSSVVTDDFILAQNSYALSPSGDQMAIVGRDSVNFYTVKVR